MDRRLLLKAQRSEITEYHIYSRLSEKTEDPNNKKVLHHMAKDEQSHYDLLKSLTKQETGPNMLKVKFYLFLAAVFGLAFSLKLMERGEKLAVEVYSATKIKYLEKLLSDEQKHEKHILNLLKEERIEYAGSIVLGLNDALVELTGALAGLTFALANGPIIAVIGLITGIAAAMSMAASEFLSSREDRHKKSEKSPAKGALYTGVAYIVTVLVLVSPYFLLTNVFAALATMITITILIIAFYTFYITTAKGLKFRRRFLEMVFISLGVAGVSFVIGVLLKVYLGIEV